MRPRHEASEIYGDGEAGGLRHGASMRPRHEASEISFGTVLIGRHFIASMRPRHEASEIPRLRGRRSAPPSGFNEAEARGLGNPAAA